MSSKVEFKNLSHEQKLKIEKDLILHIKNEKFSFAPARTIYLYEYTDNIVYLPFSYAYHQLSLTRPHRDTFPKVSNIFQGELRPEQTIVKNEALSKLNSCGSVLISSYTGFGKTIISLYIASLSGFRVLIVVNKIVLIKQWKESINAFLPESTVHIVRVKDTSLPTSNFYIVNAINMPKFGRDYFKDIGTVIVDEAHCILAELLSKSLQYVYPRYLIALTATPYRPDGLNSLFDIYFGDTKIVKELRKNYMVYVINTSFKPVIQISDKTQKINWNVALESQCMNEERNEMNR